MKSLFLIGLVFCLISSFLRAEKGDANEEIKRLHGLIEEYFYHDPPVGLDYVYQLEQVARQQKDTRLQAYAKAKVVEYYYPMFDNDSIFIVGRIAEDFARKHGEYRYLFLIQQTIIQRYANEGQFVFGLEKARKMLDDTRKFGSYEDRARAVAAMANLYKHLERYDESMDYHRESLRLMELSGKGLKAPLVLESFRELALACQRLEQYNQSLLYVDSMRMSIAEAEIDGVSDNSESLFIAECIAVDAYSGLGESGHATAALEKMEALYSADFPRMFRLLRLQSLVGYHQAKGEYEKAYEMNDELQELASLFDLTKQQPDMLRQKADLLSLMERHAEAVLAYKDAFERQMENDIARHNQQINELRTFYELDKMENQVQKDALRIRFSRNIALTLVVIVVLLGAILFLSIRQSRRIRLKNKGLVRQINEQSRLSAELATRDAEIRRLNLQPPAESQASSGETTDELYIRIRQFMQVNQPYIDPLFNWKTLVSLLDTNERLLRAALKKHLGITVSEYINRQRLNYAKQLLSDTESTIEAIAFDSGFGSRNTFYRLFREHYGLTPDEYRKAKDQKNIPLTISKTKNAP